MIDKNTAIEALKEILRKEDCGEWRLRKACELIKKYPCYFTRKELSVPEIQKLALAVLYETLKYAYNSYEYAEGMAKFVKNFNFPVKVFKTDDFFERIECLFLKYIDYSTTTVDKRIINLIMKVFSLPEDILQRDSIHDAIDDQIKSWSASTTSLAIINLVPFFKTPFSVRDRKHLMAALDIAMGDFGEIKTISKEINLSLLNFSDLNHNNSEEEAVWIKRAKFFIVRKLINGEYSYYNFLCSTFKCSVEKEIKETLMGDESGKLLDAIIEGSKIKFFLDFNSDPEVKRIINDYWIKLTKENDPRADKLEKIFFPN